VVRNLRDPPGNAHALFLQHFETGLDVRRSHARPVSRSVVRTTATQIYRSYSLSSRVRRDSLTPAVSKHGPLPAPRKVARQVHEAILPSLGDIYGRPPNFMQRLGKRVRELMSNGRQACPPDPGVILLTYKMLPASRRGLFPTASDDPL